MGLLSIFKVAPSLRGPAGHISHNSLPARIDVNMLDANRLLATCRSLASISACMAYVRNSLTARFPALSCCVMVSDRLLRPTSFIASMCVTAICAASIPSISSRGFVLVDRLLPYQQTD
jgi:hypothetical protein